MKAGKLDRRTLFLLGIVVILAIGVIWSNTDRKVFALGGSIESLTHELESAQAAMMELQGKLERPGAEWVTENDVILLLAGGSDPRITAWQKIDELSAQCGISLKSRGQMTETSIGEGIVGYELTIDADAGLVNACNFIIALSSSQPRFFWNTLTLRPAGGGVSISGTLRMVVITQEKVATRLWGSKK